MSRLWILPLFAGAMFFSYSSHQTDASISQEKPPISRQTAPPDFKDSIAPLLKRNCTPCHFTGGKMYEKLPFDNYETVSRLGKKLNTRLKGEQADVVSRWIDGGLPKAAAKVEKDR
jgi:hypothetical protein